MSQEFTFEQLYPSCNNLSQFCKSIKNPNFTMSQVSNIDLNKNLFTQQPSNDLDIEEFNRKAQRKQKNKINAKNFRQRKKYQQDKLQKKIKILEKQNETLKMDKFCKNCKKPYGGYIQITEIQKEDKYESYRKNQIQKYQKQTKQYFQFQKINFHAKNQNQNNNRNGRIWIALGILMMVIGVHLYGFNGKDGYQDISISKIQSKKWIQIYENKSNNIEEYLNVKVKVKQKDVTKLIQKQKNLFKQIKIFNQQENQSKLKEYGTMAQSTLEKLDMIQEQKQNKLNQEKSNQISQTQVKFHKQLLYAIQAEIDDLGNYI